MRYFLAFLVNDLTAESHVLPLMDRREKSVEQLMAEARRRVEWENAGVTLVEIDAPPVATWNLLPYVPADMGERTDSVLASADEMRFRRLVGD